MIKVFEVVKEEKVEVRFPRKTLRNKTLSQFYGEQPDWCYETLQSFKNKEEAQEFFEKEKDGCITKYVETSAIGKIIEFDVLQLQELDYDEDSDYFELVSVWDEYIAPIPED